MGGQTIAEILENAPWTADGRHLLLLQPMTMVYELRQWLWANGYAIERETLCREDRRQYVILSVRGNAEKRELVREECALSDALLAAPGAAAYIRYILEREQRALRGMERSDAAESEKLIGPEFLLTHFSQSDSLVLLWDIFLYLFHS